MVSLTPYQDNQIPLYVASTCKNGNRDVVMSLMGAGTDRVINIHNDIYSKILCKRFYVSLYDFPSLVPRESDFQPPVLIFKFCISNLSPACSCLGRSFIHNVSCLPYDGGLFCPSRWNTLYVRGPTFHHRWFHT